MNKNLETFANVDPMVDEIISHDEMMELVRKIRNMQQVHDYSFLYALIANGGYVAWDGSIHKGLYLNIFDSRKKCGDGPKVYFIEITYDNPYYYRGRMFASPMFHKGMPIATIRDVEMAKLPFVKSALNEDVRNLRLREGNTMKVDELVALIQGKKEFICPPEERRKYEAYRKDAVKKLKNLEVPPEDDLWYSLLDGELADSYREVSAYVNRHGHHMRIDGERDSFGWVTKGIFVDDTIMCIY